MLTQARLKELFHYDEATGIFVRRVDNKNGVKAGRISGTTSRARKQYRVIRIDRVLYFCHRLAWLYVHGEFPPGFVDHINGDGLDNRIENLRVVTNAQNVQASLRLPKHNTSGLKGASYNKLTKKWIAGISINNKRKHIGAFETAEQAHKAYMDEKRKVHYL